MPIINGNRFQKKSKLKAAIDSEIMKEMEAYCAWAKIDDVGFFIEEAVSFVFAKDRDWKQHNKAVKKASKKKSAATAEA